MSEEQKVSRKLHEGIWKIERYGVCGIDGWNDESFVDSNTYLMFKHLTLVVISNATVLDLIPLASNVRMVIKYDSIGIAVNHDDKTLRKIRLKFAKTNAHSGIVVARSCAALLNKYIEIEDLSLESTFGECEFVECLKSGFKQKTQPPEKSHVPTSTDFNGSKNGDVKLVTSLQDHISQLMNKNLTELYSGEKDFSSMYPLKEIIEVCILDQAFPSFVAEVHETLLKTLKEK